MNRRLVSESLAASPGKPALTTIGCCAVYRSRSIVCSRPGYAVGDGTGFDHGLNSSAGVHRWLATAPAHSALEPKVMLSPNASVLVFSRRGGGATVTLKVQDTRVSDVVAEQPTAVVPTAKSDPLAGVHVA